MKILF
jgi:exonuclease III